MCTERHQTDSENQIINRTFVNSIYGFKECEVNI